MWQERDDSAKMSLFEIVQTNAFYAELRGCGS